MLGLKLDNGNKRGPWWQAIANPMIQFNDRAGGGWGLFFTASHMGGYRDSKIHGANMRPSWGRQDPGGPHVGPMNFAIWVL